MRRVSRRSKLAISLVFFGVVALRLALLPFLPVPVPGIHDEFSNLLLGDTFAHGRLTNPAHPLWRSFETFHVNWHPTYHSIYPPAQGAALALGEILGNPWIGVLLTAAGMCAAVFWMLRGWIPSRWALLGAVLVALKFGVSSYWMNSYWGGAVAGIGGALVLGALARICRAARARDALLFALGVAILANSRPYEGFLFCVPVAFVFFRWYVFAGKSQPSFALRTRRVFLPVLAVLSAAVVFMGYYNWRLTGDPFLMPHQLAMRTYHSAKPFLWQKPGPPLAYDNRQFEDFYNGWERANYNRTWNDAKRVSMEKVTRLGSAFFWPGLLLVLPGLPFLFCHRKLALPLVILFIVVAGVFCVVWSNAHYAAPIVGVIYLLIAQSMRRMRAWTWRGKPWGAALVCSAVALLAVDTAKAAYHRECDPIWWTCKGDISRLVIERKLQRTPGRHLVIVRYAKGHNVHDEWVYNGADIDSAKVVWARELDPRQNAKLLAYFKDRRIWLVTPDTDNTLLLPYPQTPAVK